MSYMCRLLRGDRPYWWVGLHREVWPPSKELIQVPITCETGPGLLTNA